VGNQKSIMDPRNRSAGLHVEADRHLERVASLHFHASRDAPKEEIELYHRTSTVHRVAREAGGVAPETQAGREEGIAVRLRSRRDRSPRFAASSGGDARAVGWAVERASASHGGDLEGPGWAAGRGDARLDRDAVVERVTDEDLAVWLDQVWERATAATKSAPFPLSRAWVEVGTTLETWVAHGGLRASRARMRAWAVAIPGGPTRNASLSRPAVIAARSWSALREMDWQGILEDRVWRVDAAEPARSARLPVLFSPEATSTLATALIKAVHSSDEALGKPVGSGWRVQDRPRTPEVLLGSAYDDCGFGTSDRVLADGDRIQGSIGGPGCFRRPSFRDPPRPEHSELVVAHSEPGHLPPRTVLAATIKIHPLDTGQWIVQFEGGVLTHGEPAGAITAGFVKATPHQLVERCLAGYGPVRQSYLGIQTPALLFDSLPVCWD